MIPRWQWSIHQEPIDRANYVRPVNYLRRVKAKILVQMFGLQRNYPALKGITLVVAEINRT